jgi:hypothetical protein
VYPPPPEKDDEYLVADYVEFCCLLSEDGEYSASDAEADRAREEELEPSVVDEPADAALRVATGLSLIGAEQRVVALLSGETSGSDVTFAAVSHVAGEEPVAALSADMRALLTHDVAQHLTYRALTFGDGYPFEFDHSTQSLRVRSLSPRARRLYIFLLAAATLRAFSASERSTLTTQFERLAVPTMRGHMPGAEVHAFGTAGDGGLGRYRGKLSEKVRLLAEDLRIDLVVALDKISPRNTGDQGIDAVVWFAPRDSARTMIAIFVQCACSREEWPHKLLAAAEEAFAFWFHFYSPVTNLVMIPFCFRDASGDWFDPNDMKKGVLFDRVRILVALEQPGSAAAAARAIPNTLLRSTFSHRGFPGRHGPATSEPGLTSA